MLRSPLRRRLSSLPGRSAARASSERHSLERLLHYVVQDGGNWSRPRPAAGDESKRGHDALFAAAFPWASKTTTTGSATAVGGLTPNSAVEVRPTQPHLTAEARAAAMTLRDDLNTTLRTLILVNYEHDSGFAQLFEDEVFPVHEAADLEFFADAVATLLPAASASGEFDDLSELEAECRFTFADDDDDLGTVLVELRGYWADQERAPPIESGDGKADGGGDPQAACSVENSHHRLSVVLFQCAEWQDRLARLHREFSRCRAHLVAARYFVFVTAAAVGGNESGASTACITDRIFGSGIDETATGGVGSPSARDERFSAFHRDCEPWLRGVAAARRCVVVWQAWQLARLREEVAEFAKEVVADRSGRGATVLALLGQHVAPVDDLVASQREARLRVRVAAVEGCLKAAVKLGLALSKL